MMEAVRTSETMVNFYQTTRRYNPEDSHVQKNSFTYKKNSCFNSLKWEEIERRESGGE
jgi:hypothetical protein